MFIRAKMTGGCSWRQPNICYPTLPKFSHISWSPNHMKLMRYCSTPTQVSGMSIVRQFLWWDTPADTLKRSPPKNWARSAEVITCYIRLYSIPDCLTSHSGLLLTFSVSCLGLKLNYVIIVSKYVDILFFMTSLRNLDIAVVRAKGRYWRGENCFYLSVDPRQLISVEIR